MNAILFHDLNIRDYKETWDYQQQLFDEVVATTKTEKPEAGHLIFVEHPHVYTLGKSGNQNNLLLDYIQLQARNASFYKIDRGGDITYHGPGQIVGYPIFNLTAMKLGLKEYIHLIEEAIIRTVAEYGIVATRLNGATGVWLDVDTPKARKICAIGVKSSHWVTMHGFALNVNTQLDYFGYINPCGFVDKGVTSIEKELGATQDFEKAKQLTLKHLQQVFNLELTN